jgi:hypothetical protein
MSSSILDANEISWKEIYDELNYKYELLFDYVYILDHDVCSSSGKIKLENEFSEKQIRNYIANVFLEHNSKMDIVYKDIENKSIDDESDETDVVFEI